MPLNSEPVRFDELDSLPPALAATLCSIGPSRTAYLTAIRLTEKLGLGAAIQVLDQVADNQPEEACVVIAGKTNPYQVAIQPNGGQPGKIIFIPKGGRMQ